MKRKYILIILAALVLAGCCQDTPSFNISFDSIMSSTKFCQENGGVSHYTVSERYVRSDANPGRNEHKPQVEVHGPYITNITTVHCVNGAKFPDPTGFEDRY